ncbi:hypothetical protein LCGC14_1848930 [marine sediment metagenome]|uniref:Uncharacterized protein n=1 Tax=marine sediment metagenome TaxID=412755 RepID=A0A0F9GB41_9ZZZZ
MKIDFTIKTQEPEIKGDTVPLELAFEKNSEGDIYIRARHRGTGKAVNLLYLTCAGYVVLARRVPEDAGFQLDHRGCIVVDK